MAVQRSDFVYFLTASVLTCLLLAVSFFTARRDEAAHLARLARREHELRHIRLLSGKRPPDTFRQGQLVQGSVVMGCGYFRNFATNCASCSAAASPFTTNCSNAPAAKHWSA